MQQVHLTWETPLRPPWKKELGDVDAQRLLAEGANLLRCTQGVIRVLKREIFGK